ncbi:MAG: orotidine 5'-phosphate decarboxylase / HUMPS family protein [Candidatus Moraniibacteriota bacterium]
MAQAMVMPELIIAADFDPTQGGRGRVESSILRLTRELTGLPVRIKLNSALRAIGTVLPIFMVARGAQRIMADLKLTDISETLAFDGRFLIEHQAVHSVTVMCGANVAAMRALCQEVQPAGIKVIGVMVPTSWDDDDCRRVYGCSVVQAVKRLALLGAEAGLDGLVTSGKELLMLRAMSELANMSFEVPGIRPAWAIVPGDDQKRVVTPAEAIRLGASSIIVGRPITQAKQNDEGRPQSPREAAERTLQEMSQALGCNSQEDI